MTSIVIFKFHDNYSGIQQNTTCKAGSAQKTQKCTWSARDSICSNFLSHKSFAKCFTEKKNRQQFPHRTGYGYRRESNALVCYSKVLLKRIAYVARLRRPPIIVCRRPKVQLGLSLTATFVSRRSGCVNVLGSNGLPVVYQHLAVAYQRLLLFLL